MMATAFGVVIFIVILAIFAAMAVMVWTLTKGTPDDETQGPT